MHKVNLKTTPDHSEAAFNFFHPISFTPCYSFSMTNPFETPPAEPPKPKESAAEGVPAPRTKFEDLSPEEQAHATAWLPQYEQGAEPTPVSPEECEEREKEFLGLIVAFEASHPIDELYAVTELDGKDVNEHPEKYPVRVVAKRDLGPIVTALNILKDLKERGLIPPEKYEALKARYTYLSRAVGIINNGKVDHTR